MASEWDPHLEELARRRAAARAMGGPDRLARQHAGGRLDARQRMQRLFDEGTFVELGTLAGGATGDGGAGHEDDAGDGGPRPSADALVAGFGRIEGRPALAGAEDFTVLGGSIGSETADKRYRLCQLAAQERVPLVFMLEGAGHRLTNRPAGRRPNDLQGLADLSGLVPMVCLVMGPSAGHGALTAPLADFVVMTPSAALFSAGPPLVKAALGEDASPAELGGPDVHVAGSGVAHNRATDDGDAIGLARRYLSYFPSNAWSRAPAADGPDAGPRTLDRLLDMIPPDPRRPYAMRPVLAEVFDAGSTLEVQPEVGAGVVCTLARLGGESVAVVANDPSVAAGAVDAAGARKAARFLEVCGAFHLPAVFVADNPGVMAGTAAEREGTLREVARMFAAQHRLTEAKLHVTVRKAFGFGSTLMAMNPFDGQTLTLAFPAVTLGALPARAGAPSAKLDTGEGERLASEQASGGYRAASSMSYDEVVDPRDLRNKLLAGLALTEVRRSGPTEPARRVGILP